MPISRETRSVGGIPKEPADYGGKDLWNRRVLGLKRKTEGVMDGESKDGDCDEVIMHRMR